MKITIIFLTILFVFARCYEAKLSPSAITSSVKKVVKTIDTVQKVVSKFSPQSQTLKNVLRIRDGLQPETWQKIENSINFFKKVKKILKISNITTTDASMQNPDNFQEDEILICRPNTKGSKCHSPCIQGTSSYRWCYRQPNSSFDYCSCYIRNSVKHWIVLMKKEMDLMLLKQKSAKTSSKHVDENVIQWVVISLLATALASLIIAILARIGYNYRKSNNVIVNQNVEGIDVMSF